MSVFSAFFVREIANELEDMHIYIVILVLFNLLAKMSEVREIILLVIYAIFLP
jgi:hypothetical protein